MVKKRRAGQKPTRQKQKQVEEPQPFFDDEDSSQEWLLDEIDEEESDDWSDYNEFD